MRVLVRSGDVVLISFAEATLTAAGLRPMIADRYISGVEGRIGAFPVRVMVAEADWDEACRALEVAGIGHEIVREPS